MGGFDIECSVSSRSIEGRIGGLFRGADVNFVINQQGLITGRMGGGIVGQDVRLRFTEEEIGGRVGGDVVGKDIALKVSGYEIGGRVGGDTVGFSCRLKYNPNGGELRGRMGGQFMGHDVNLVVSDCPLVLAALLAALTYNYYLSTQSSNAGSTSGSR